jgi:hypothetical protein
MKTQFPRCIIVLSLLALSTLNLQLTTARAQGTAFTYQGRLNNGSAADGGTYDLTFTLFSANASGVVIAGPVTNSATVVSNGLFTTTVDFGAGVFTGTSNWLEIAVRTNGNGVFATLNPRQQLTPTPYALYAPKAGAAVIAGSATVAGSANSVLAGNISGTIPLAQLPSTLVTNGASGLTLSGTFTGNGANVTNVNAATLGGLASSNFWKTSGNAGANPTNGAYLGTSDNLPLEIKINGARALRLEYGYDPFESSIAPNLTGGYSGNTVNNGVYGAFIGGGGNAGYPNRVGGSYASVVGGLGNTASGTSSTAMGSFTTASDDHSTAMGSATIASGYSSTAMGYSTTASGYSSIAMGYFTTASGHYSTAMGYSTIASGDYSTAMGYLASAAHQGSFVWADYASFTPFSSTATNQFLIRAGGGVGINKNNPAAALDVNGTARIQGANNWDVNNSEGDFRVGNDVQRFKIGVATTGGGAGDVWMRAQGGTARVFIKTPGGTTFYSNEGQTAGVSLAADGTAWAVVSDRNVKKDFAAINSVQILEKLAAMPITQWHFKWETSDVTPHIGPMAQDFKAAFYPGTDDKSITTQEADGVALAAIQGLNQKLNDKDVEIQDLKRSVADLKKMVQSLAEKK